MISIALLRTMALSFPEVIEQPHFEKTSFRVNKKIFASIDSEAKIICIKLSEIDQDVFCKIDKQMIYPVPNKWGKQGWTYINATIVNEEVLKHALIAAYCIVAPAKLAHIVKADEQDFFSF